MTSEMSFCYQFIPKTNCFSLVFLIYQKMGYAQIRKRSNKGVSLGYENHSKHKLPCCNFFGQLCWKHNHQALSITILSNFPKFPKCSRKFLNKQCHKYDYAFVSVYTIILVQIGEFHILVYFLDASKEVSHNWMLLVKNNPSLPLKA